MRSFLVVMACLVSSAAFAGEYSLTDLEVLAQENSHEEFFKHALDVRPSERQENWKGMVTKMGAGYSRGLLRKSAIDKADFHKVEALFSWPVLHHGDVFKINRREIGLRYLRTCVRDAEPCWNDLKTFWEADMTDPELAVNLAELMPPREDAPYTVWTFLEVALKSPLSEFYCKKEFVMKSLWGKLEVDYVRLGQEGDLLKKIDQTLHADCLPALNAEARKKLLSPIGPTDRELSYQILKSQGKMDEKTSDFFFTVYLLENPGKGELFNYAWNRLRDLGKAPDRREELLTTIRAKLDPLPDDIITSLDVVKKRVILNHFKQNFPEYLDFYVNRCLAYYSGKETFPNGNPAVHCQDMMNSDVAKDVLPPSSIEKFQEIRKI